MSITHTHTHAHTDRMNTTRYHRPIKSNVIPSYQYQHGSNITSTHIVIYSQAISIHTHTHNSLLPLFSPFQSIMIVITIAARFLARFSLHKYLIFCYFCCSGCWCWCCYYWISVFFSLLSLSPHWKTENWRNFYFIIFNRTYFPIYNFKSKNISSSISSCNFDNFSRSFFSLLPIVLIFAPNTYMHAHT